MIDFPREKGAAPGDWALARPRLWQRRDGLPRHWRYFTGKTGHFPGHGAAGCPIYDLFFSA